MDPFEGVTIAVVEDNLILLNFLMAFIMFGVALDMKWEDFKRVFKFPQKVAIGLSSQLILLPALTFLLVLAWKVEPQIALGLILIGSVPGGNLSNFTVQLGKGNTALSVTMTSIVTITAVLFTPLLFGGWSQLWLYIVEPDLSSSVISVPFLKLLEIIVILIIIPLSLGMTLANTYPKLINKIKKPIRIVSLVIFLAFIIVAMIGNIDNIIEYWEHIIIIVIVHNILALLTGYYYAKKVWHLDIADSKAICLETGIQNGGLALILIFNFFQELPGMMLVVGWWGVWDMVSSLALGAYWSHKAKNRKVAI